jgi:hypothetical protein
LLIFWTIGEHIRTNNEPLLVDPLAPWSASRSTSVHLAFIEAIKISTTGIIYMRCKETGPPGRHRSYASIHQDEEARGYSTLHSSHGFLRPAIMTDAVAFFYAFQNYLVRLFVAIVLVCLISFVRPLLRSITLTQLHFTLFSLVLPSVLCLGYSHSSAVRSPVCSGRECFFK